MVSKLFLLFASSFFVVQNSFAATSARNLLFGGLLEAPVQKLTTAINIDLSILLTNVKDLVDQLFTELTNRRELIPTVVSQLNEVLIKAQNTLDRAIQLNIPFGSCSNIDVIETAASFVNDITNTAANCLDATATAINTISGTVIDRINDLQLTAGKLLRRAISCLNHPLLCGLELLGLATSVTSIVAEITSFVSTVNNGAMVTLGALNSDIDNCLPLDTASQYVSDVNSLTTCLQAQQSAFF